MSHRLHCNATLLKRERHTLLVREITESTETVYLSHRSHGSNRYSLFLGDGIHSSGAIFMATECPLFTGARAPFTLRESIPSPWEERLLRYERAHRRRGKGGWLLVRIVRTSRPNGPYCVSERLGRGASLWVAPLKMIRKLNQKIKVKRLSPPVLP